MVQVDVDNIARGIRRLFQAGLFDVFGADVINKVLTFLSGIIIVRIIPQEAYGTYAYAFNIVNIILLFNGLGTASAILQFASEHAFEKRKVAVERAGVRVGLFFDGLVAIVMFILPLIVDLPLSGSEEMVRCWCIYPCLQLIYDIQLVSLRSSLKNREYAICTNLNTVFILIGSVAGALFGGAYGLIFGRIVAMVASVALIAVLFKVPECFFEILRLRRFELGVQFNAEGHPVLTRSEKHSFLGISITTAINSGINQLVYYLGTAIIGVLTSNAFDIAIFQTTLAIPTALNFIPSTLAIFVYPYFARHKDEPKWVMRRYRQLMIAVIPLAAIVSMGIIVFSPWIIFTLYGDAYVSGASILRILMIGWFFSASFRTIASNLLITQRKLAYGILVASGSALLTIILNWRLVPAFGIVGAAWAQVLVYVVSGFAYSAYFLLSVLGKIRQNSEKVDSECPR